MTQNKKIAITGGIGSGKTTVAKIIAEQGFNVISCDEIYKQLLCNKNFLSALASEFGDILNADGNLDRKKLSDIVFNDGNKLKKLNDLTHPAIMQEAICRMEGQGLCFCEVPLLFEEGYEKLFDNVIVVLRNLEDRVSALSERDGLDKFSIYSRIKSQYDYDNNIFEKYYVIHNNSDFAELRNKTFEILRKLTF